MTKWIASLVGLAFVAQATVSLAFERATHHNVTPLKIYWNEINDQDIAEEFELEVYHDPDDDDRCQINLSNCKNFHVDLSTGAFEEFVDGGFNYYVVEYAIDNGYILPSNRAGYYWSDDAWEETLTGEFQGRVYTLVPVEHETPIPFTGLRWHYRIKMGWIYIFSNFAVEIFP